MEGTANVDYIEMLVVHRDMMKRYCRVDQMNQSWNTGQAGRAAVCSPREEELNASAEAVDALNAVDTRRKNRNRVAAMGDVLLGLLWVSQDEGLGRHFDPEKDVVESQ